MGNWSSSQSVYLNQIDTITTEDPGNAFEVTIKCDLEIKDGKPVAIFHPNLRQGEKHSNPFLGLSQFLVQERRMACIYGIYLVQQSNDLKVPITFKIADIFSVAFDYKFTAFPRKEVASLAPKREKPSTNNTGKLFVEIPGNCGCILANGMELYTSPISKRGLMTYAGSDALFCKRNAIVVDIDQTTERLEDLELAQRDANDTSNDGGDNNNNNNNDNDNNSELRRNEKPKDKLDADHCLSDVNQLSYVLLPLGHIVIRAIGEFGDQLKISLAQCKKLERVGKWQVPNWIYDKIQAFMDTTFFCARRYTTCSNTSIALVAKESTLSSIVAEIDRCRQKNWRPQVSFTLWVKYIKVADENSKTQLSVTRI